MDGEEAVDMTHLEYAKDKILMGAERKSAVIDAKNRRLVAYHEGGHALVAMYTDGAMPVHKATIMPRGRALGMVRGGCSVALGTACMCECCWFACAGVAIARDGRAVVDAQAAPGAAGRVHGGPGG
jgi:hypothetical protein